MRVTPGRWPRDDGAVGHLEISDVTYHLPDGRTLLDSVSLRVADGARVALVGPNVVGKSTLLRVVTGELAPHGGTVVRSGGLGVMRQQLARGDDERTVRDLLVELAAAVLDILTVDDEPAQMRYAQALADWADVGGYDAETAWDLVTDEVLSVPFEKAQWRDLRTLSGG